MIMKIFELFDGVKSGILRRRSYVVHSYCYIPTGCILLFILLYGINKFLQKIKFSFPPSILLMIINFLSLLILKWLLPIKWFKTYFEIIQVPMQFCLSWMNVFFIPSFVILPLQQPISIIECIKIAAVFIIGYIVLAAIVAYTCILLQAIFKKKHLKSDNYDDKKQSNEESRENDAVFDEETDQDVELQQIEPQAAVRNKHHSISNSINSNLIEELSDSSEHHESIIHPSLIVSDHDNLSDNQFNNLSPIAMKISNLIFDYIDWIIYFLLFIIGTPIYYTHPNITVFLHLAITTICYYIAILIPSLYRKYFHPILVSVAIILLIIFSMAALQNTHRAELKNTFLTAITSYKTGRNYKTLFNPKAYPYWPGAGDVLSSLMDIAIVSLSLPMFNYRNDLKQNAIYLIPPISISCGICFFAYPPLCHHIGISSQRSLGFVGRSVTLALGTPLIQALDGSVSLMSICTILSGIIGVLTGGFMMDLLGINKNDYVTRGVTLGISCGAISTAHLLVVDPRAASFSSLGFLGFGTTMVILGVITPLATLIKGWAGMV